MLIPFSGNCPRNANKDAKYISRYLNGKYVAGVVYQSLGCERWYPFSGDHDELDNIVNAVKLKATGKSGGAFYINEYKQVIVPTSGHNPGYFYAGEYDKPLKFEVEGKLVSGDSVNHMGLRLEPGFDWTGSHAGVPYVLSAAKKDIIYELEIFPNVVKTVRLSQNIGERQALEVVSQLMRFKLSGGRIYVNEYCKVFAPVESERGYSYIYLGEIDFAKWFPKPQPTVTSPSE